MLALYVACRLHTTDLSSDIQCLNQVNSGLCIPIVRMYADEPDECPLRMYSRLAWYVCDMPRWNNKWDNMEL